MYGRYPYQGQIPPPPQGGQGLTSNPGGFGQGVMQFIQSYRGEQAAKKENAAKMFEKHAAMLAQGLPVDKKKMAKWAREADLHFDLDPPPPPPAQAPMTPNPQMQGAAQYGMQQAMGGPSVQQAPPPAPPPQQGMMGRLAGAIGQATGAPQPPNQAQQMGVMRMLDEIQKRGQSSQEMAGMQEQAKMAGLKAMQTIEQGLQMGLTMEDPRMAKALSTVYMLRGLQGGDMGGLGKIAESDMARKLFPKLTERISAQASEAQQKKMQTEYRTKVAGMVKDPEKAAKAEAWVLGQTDDFPDFGGGVDAMEAKKFVTSLMNERPGVTPEQANAVAIAMYSPDATAKDVAKAYEGLPESITHTRLKMAKTSESLRQRSDARAEESLGIRKQEMADDAAVKMATGQILQLTGGDPDKAYDNVQKYAAAAFGGDIKSATQHLPEIQKYLKSLSKNPDMLEQLLKGAAEAGARAAKEPQ